MPQLSLMIKPASGLCNMRCKYCFYGDVKNLRQQADFGMMTEETAENLIKKALDFADGEQISFAFQGGEPTLHGIDFFKFFVEKVGELNVKKSKIYYSIQTNGTTVDEEWCDFFVKNGFLVGLSLDGDRNGNRFRKLADGGFSFPVVEKAAELMEEKGVDFNILIVLTGYAAKHAEEAYAYFKKKGWKYLQYIPCLRPFGSTDEGEAYMTVDDYSAFLIKIFNKYVKDYADGNYVSIRLFDNWVNMYLGKMPEQCGLLGGCARQFVAEANGNVYPCDFYCLDEWLLGNVNTSGFTEMANSPTALKFVRNSVNTPEKCKKCPYFGLCRSGGCKRQRADRDYCEAYRRFFSACLPLFRVFKWQTKENE